jgi:hypothetical protein
MPTGKENKAQHDDLFADADKTLVSYKFVVPVPVSLRALVPSAGADHNLTSFCSGLQQKGRAYRIGEGVHEGGQQADEGSSPSVTLICSRVNACAAEQGPLPIIVSTSRASAESRRIDSSFTAALSDIARTHTLRPCTTQALMPTISTSLAFPARWHDLLSHSFDRPSRSERQTTSIDIKLE